MIINFTQNKADKEESKRNTEETFTKTKEKSVHMKDPIIKAESSDKEDNWNIADDDITNETSVADRWDNLNKLNISSMIIKWEFSKNNPEANPDDLNSDVNKPDDQLVLTEESNQRDKSSSEVSIKKSKNLDSMITKAPSPFTVAPNLQKKESNKTSGSEGTPSSENRKKERDSIDVWRASDIEKEIDAKVDWDESNNLTRDDMLNQWLGTGKRNNTIYEDVEAENAEEQSRFSKYSAFSDDVNSQRDSEYKDQRDSQFEKQRDSKFEENNKVEYEQPEEEEENELHKIHMLQSLQALQYMKGVEVPDEEELSDKFVYLPPFKNPKFTKTLIFDMDETLIHWVDDIQEEFPQVVLDVCFDDGEIVDAGINIRPYAIDCLKAANELFQVIVFTASHKWYADTVLDFLDPTGELIQYRLYRDSWYKTEDNVYIKDLRIIRNRELKDMVIGKLSTYFRFSINLIYNH